ncbi:zinc finger protein 652-like [Eupeodes corollae]|uniref:zinc finger protein 652-like n=1 Tax=Eupeodes corollae TaxID=290404 RepID=UPI00249202B8|nr:zinc finger protein 652-like [Eupeodes corollae]
MEMEDKKCRICGLADMDNFNIFQSKTLPAKIVAVYPIALYRNDPLPKHICKKCHVSTHNMYTEMERALRNQAKWMANIRLAQPDNQYLKVVDSIAGANKQTSQLVSLIAGAEMGERTISKLFNFESDQYVIPKKRAAGDENASLETDKIEESEDLSVELIEAELAAEAKRQQSTSPQASLSKPTTPPKAKITQLKSVLELNGCTLTKLKPSSAKTSPGAQKKKLEDSFEEMKVVDIKAEPLDEPEEMEAMGYIPVLTELKPEYQVKCKMCPFSSETIEELAIHQLEHLSLATWKLSERRILNKRIRRGRLIMVEEKKCIRCLNCWRIFADNKSILQHWSDGECDFFCQICGKEFATSPKMLREHIPAAHGISYRSSKILRPISLSCPRKPLKIEKSPCKPTKSPIKTEPSLQRSKPSPTKTKADKPVPNGSLLVKVACSICLKVFANFKARNSHMRAHKHPPFLPAQPPPPLNETLMALNRTDGLLEIKEEPLEIENTLFQGMNPLEAAAPSTSKAGPAFTKVGATIKHPRLKVIPTRIGRKKSIQKSAIPSSVIVKTEPCLMTQEPLKVKSLVDLQDPAVSSQLSEDTEKLFFGETSTATVTAIPPSNGTPSINGLSFDFGVPPKDNMNYCQIFTCHPCGLKFNSKLELFRHKRKCSANNMFPCQFCDKHFITSADMQMHIMLMHKNSCPQ